MEKRGDEEQLKLDQERMYHKNKEKHFEKGKVPRAAGRSDKTRQIRVRWI